MVFSSIPGDIRKVSTCSSLKPFYCNPNADSVVNIETRSHARVIDWEGFAATSGIEEDPCDKVLKYSDVMRGTPSLLVANGELAGAISRNDVSNT